jgi:hypothetical protein
MTTLIHPAAQPVVANSTMTRVDAHMPRLEAFTPLPLSPQGSPLHWSARARVGAVLGLALALWTVVAWALQGSGLPH